MAKYLFKVSYSPAGLKGLLKEGGSLRRAAAEKAIQSLGGTMEAFYYCFGDADVVSIADLPDAAAAAAFSLTVNTTGAVRLSTTPLLTPEEMDRARKKSVKYRPPRG